MNYKNYSRIALFLALIISSAGVSGQLFDSFEFISNGLLPSSVHAADLDGDGFEDVLTTFSDGDIVVWNRNLGDGSFGSDQLIASSLRPWDAEAVDVDNDGDMDVVHTAYFGSAIFLSENLGSGTFAPQVSISTVGNPTDIFFEDLDNDGDKDMACTRYDADEIMWQENLGGGSFGLPIVVSTTADAALKVLAADLDNDGDFDLVHVSANDDRVAWYENLGGGIFGPIQIISSSIADFPAGLAVGDLDNDGDIDIIAASSLDDRIFWYENFGTGSFSSEKVFGTSIDAVRGIASGDLDNDGDIDVVAAVSYADQVVWYENLGGGTFGPKEVVGSYIDRPFDVFIADMDNDGDQDILTVGTDDGQVYLSRNNLIQNCLFGLPPANLSHTYTPGTVGGTLDLNWKEIPSSIGYQINVKRVSSSPPKSRSFLSPTNTKSISSGLFQSGDVFKWRVRAACPNDSTDWSNIGTIVIPTLREQSFSSDQTEEHSVLLADFTISHYPNPTDGFIRFIPVGDISIGQAFHFAVTDINGKQLHKLDGEVSVDAIELNTADWPSGVYFYQFETAGEVFDGSFVRE